MSEKEKKKKNKTAKAEDTAVKQPEQTTSSDQPEVTKAESNAAEPVEKIAALEKDMAQMKDRYLRTVAEYDNFRKRTQKEKTQIYTDAAASTIEAILPVLDNLDRALASCGEEEDSPIGQGVQMIAKQFYEVLAKLKVTEIPALGETFDPQVHNAIMHIEDEAYKEGEIIEVFQKGYQMEDKVIRHAIVKVAN